MLLFNIHKEISHLSCHANPHLITRMACEGYDTAVTQKISSNVTKRLGRNGIFLSSSWGVTFRKLRSNEKNGYCSTKNETILPLLFQFKLICLAQTFE